MLQVRILTVKPNSCGQEKEKNTVSTPRQDLDVHKTSEVCVVPAQNGLLGVFGIGNLMPRQEGLVLTTAYHRVKILSEHVGNPQAFSKNLDLHQKGNLGAMDTSVLNRPVCVRPF